jgi:hypothetical protein
MIEAWYRHRALRTVAVIAAGAVIGLLVYLFVLRDDDGSDEGQVRPGQPAVATEDDLAELASVLGHPIYWIGPQEGAELEVTRLPDDRVYVRYLTKGARIGDPRPDFFTVGTYPVKRAQRVLQGYAEQEGSIVESTGDGAMVVTNEDFPNSVYMAFPDQDDLQIEVYDEDSELALEIATSGAVRPAE